MKTGFTGPLQPRKTQKKENPWDFRMPDYDQRTSCYTNAGSHYGVGMNQPVGHKGGGVLEVACLPNSPKLIRDEYDQSLKNLPIDVQE